MFLRPTIELEPLTVGWNEKSNALPTELAGLKDSASFTNIIFQFQEFQAVAPDWGSTVLAPGLAWSNNLSVNSRTR